MYLYVSEAQICGPEVHESMYATRAGPTCQARGGGGTQVRHSIYRITPGWLVVARWHLLDRTAAAAVLQRRSAAVLLAAAEWPRCSSRFGVRESTGTTSIQERVHASFQAS